MKRIFDGMTSFSTERPKTTIAIILVFIFSLTPNAMFINFDNSEDAFFPDNETVRLLMKFKMNIKHLLISSASSTILIQVICMKNLLGNN